MKTELRDLGPGTRFLDDKSYEYMMLNQETPNMAIPPNNYARVVQLGTGELMLFHMYCLVIPIEEPK